MKDNKDRNVITEAQAELIQLLFDYLANENSNAIVFSPDLLSLAKSNQIGAILYHQTKDKLLYQAYLQTISAYIRRKEYLSQIKCAMTDIPFFSVKGMSVSNYYPIPQLRTMGDCDIVVHECDQERVQQILISMGFKYIESNWDCGELHFNKQGLDFELHHRLLYDETVNTEQEKVFADSAWNYVDNHELDPNYHFVFILIHLKKHLLNRGVGIRQFMDLAVMSQNAKLDRATVATFLKQVNLEKFAGVCSALCARWFNIALPVDTQQITDEFYNKATNMILAGGVFGFELQENEKKGLVNSVNRYGKVGSVIRKMFPLYSSCAGTIKYKWIKGKPYLMPVLWLYRPFEFLLSGRTEECIERFCDIANSDETLKERRRELAEWGL